MRSILAGTIIAAGLAISGPASADVIFNLSGVTLAGGGTLTGSFTLNNALNSVVAADIVASAFGPFTGYNYAFPGATLSQSLPTQYLQLASSGDELRIYFTAPVTSTSATILLSHLGGRWMGSENAARGEGLPLKAAEFEVRRPLITRAGTGLA